MALFFGLEVAIWLIGAVASLAIFHWYKSCFYDYWKNTSVPSAGKKSVTEQLRNLLKRKPVWEMYQELYQKHRKFCGIYEGGTPTLFVSDPDLIKMILVKDFQSFHDKRPAPTPDGIVGKMSSYLQGEDWKRIRSIVSPVFTSLKMRKLKNLVNKFAVNIADSLLEFAEKKMTVELKKKFSGFSLDVIASTAFATEMDSIRNPDTIFSVNMRKLLSTGLNWRLIFLAIAPKLMRKLGITSYNRKNLQFLIDLSLQIRERRKTGEQARDDFLQMLIDAEAQTEDKNCDQDENYYGAEKGPKILPKNNSKKTLTTDELVATCITFYIAGYETTATTMALVCYHLALNPECQDRLQKEVDQTWENHQGNLDFEAVNHMKYMEAVIAETLRLYPPVTKLKRMCVKEYILGDTGFTIPKGMFIQIPVYPLHRDPEYFPEPDKFIPERFLSENKDSIKPYTYLPFGSGPRNCVGIRFAQMSMKLGLVHVLRAVSFHKCSETQTPFEYTFFHQGSTLQPKAVAVGVERRF